MREGDWKLIANGRDTTGESSPRPKREGKLDKIFLGNLTEKEPEFKNHAKEQPEMVARLTRLHEEWLKDVMKGRDS